MKKLLGVLIFIATALTNSSCGILWDIYESQQNYLAPQHTLEENNEYEVVWSRSDIESFTLISSSNKAIVQGAQKGKIFQASVFGINSTTGEILWEIPGSNAETIIANDNVLYRGTVGTTKVYAHKIENGELLWSTFLPLVHSTSSLSYANNKIYVHSNNDAFYVLNEQGEIIDNFWETSIIFSVIDDVLYMEENYSLKAVDYLSKKALWQVDIGQRYTDPVFEGREIIVKTWTYSADIYSIDRYTQKINWVTAQEVASNLCLIKGKIYFINPDGFLMAIDQPTGNEISRVKFSPQFDLAIQIGTYSVACDVANDILVISFGDNTQIMGLKVMTP